MHLQTYYKNFTSGWKFSYPLMLSMVVSVGIIVVDNIMLGQLGTEELAAGALLNEAMYVIIFFCTFTLNAIGINTAKSMGENDSAEIINQYSQGIYLALILGGLGMVTIFFLPSFFISIGQKPHIISLTQNYLYGLIFGLPAILLFATYRFFSNALFKTGLALKTFIIALPLNALLNYILGYGVWSFEGWGIFGIGLASACVNWFTVGYIYYSMKNDHNVSPFMKYTAPNLESMKSILKLGLPIGSAKALEIFMFFSATMMMGLLNTSALAAHTIVTYYGVILFCFMGGFSQGTAIRIGNATGRREPIFPIFMSNIFILIIAIIILLVSFLAFCEPLVRVYIDKQNPNFHEILGFAKSFFIFNIFYLSIDMVHCCFYMALNAMKDTYIPMIINLVFFSFLATAAGYIFAFILDMKASGVWYGLILGVTAATICLVIRFNIVHRHYKNNILQITTI